MNQTNSEYDQLINEEAFIPETVSQIMQEQPIFLEEEVQNGNFDIVIFSVDMNKLDSTGYSVMHHAITYGRIDVVRYLLSKGCDHNLKSAFGQTNLMIAASFGECRMIKIFIDLGLEVNSIDNFGFTPLLYAIKSKHHKAAFYLIALGASLEARDNQGCSLMHWAAYNNDVYFLKFLEGKPYKLLDNSGNTPAMRALKNYSIDSLDYLLTKYPEMMPEKVELIKSPGVDAILSRHAKQQIIQKGFKRCSALYYKNMKIIQIIFLLVILALASLNYSSLLQKLMQKPFGFNLIVITAVVIIFCCFYLVWYITSTTYNQNDGSSVSEILGHPKMHFDCHNCDHQDHQEINQLIQVNEVPLNIVSAHLGTDEETIIHKVHNIYESQIEDTLDLYNTCSKCLQEREQKTIHCSECNICVDGFHFHCKITNRCVNATNFIFYYFSLIAINLTVCLLLLNHHYLYSTQPIIESIFTNGIQNLAYYLFNFHLFLYTLLYIIIHVIIYNKQFIHICLNLTYDELMNPHQYKYLYRPVRWQEHWYSELKRNYNILSNMKEFIWNSFTKTRVI